jgi:hypothetical protein
MSFIEAAGKLTVRDIWAHLWGPLRPLPLLCSVLVTIIP